MEPTIRVGDGNGKGRLFRGLFDLIPVTVIVVRGQRLMFINKAAEARTGYSRDELMAMNFWNVVHPDHRTPTKRLARELLEGKETFTETELKIIAKDGSEIWVELRATRAAIDKRPAIIASLMEVTDRKRMEEELKTHHDRLSIMVEERTREICREVARRKEKEQKYLSLVECVPGWVWETDASLVYTYLGSRISDYLGYKPEDLLGKSPLDIVPADERERLAPIMRTVAREKVSFVPFTFQVFHKNGSVILVQGNAQAFFDENGSFLGYRGSARDITEERRALDALQEHQQELVAKSRRLEEVNTALKVLLRQREDDRKELEERFVSNVREMVLPYLNRMRRTRLDRDQQNYLDIVMSNLNEIASPLLNILRHANLTPRELEVASLIKEGRRTKEIAEIAGIAPCSVDSHRNAIRKKLGLSTRKINLRSYLLTLK